MYVSIDDKYDSWTDAKKHLNLKEKDNFLLPNVSESVVSKQLDLISIPRYIIVGKNGQVINPNAPRPSDPKLLQIFDELLKK